MKNLNKMIKVTNFTLKNDLFDFFIFVMNSKHINSRSYTAWSRQTGFIFGSQSRVLDPWFGSKIQQLFISISKHLSLHQELASREIEKPVTSPAKNATGNESKTNFRN